jgi:murein L,D-transpeptidase YcbB/YkuD
MKKDYIGHLVENPKSLLEDEIHIYQGGREVDPSKVNWEKYLNYDGKIPYQMIQKAGDKNVLGAMKFIFPNKYNVYLHDTNAKHLTTRRYRLYSSGCIRLSDPYMFLSLLAPYTGYSYEKLEKIIEKGKTTHIRLKKKIPIHIRYLTVFVDQDGSVNFRKDFYGFDKIQSALLRH